MTGPLDRLPRPERSRLQKADNPGWHEPSLATLTKDRFSDPDWIFERKLDGERCLAFKKKGQAGLWSRNRKRLDDSYPELTRALAGQAAGDFLVDGEVVAFSGRLTSFSRLQRRMHRPAEAGRGVAVYYYIFDLLHLSGRDLTGLPLRRRKSLLKETLSFKDPLRYTPHRNREGEKLYEQACQKGWEGLIAKRATGPYRAGRSTDWLKFKCLASQELVIGGYTDPGGKRTGFGALLLGYYRDGELVYAGKVGAGFDEDALHGLKRKLAARDRSTRPFSAGQPPDKGVHWVRPDLVAEIGFTEWTRDGRLRHPRFLGLRRDKAPRSVVREDKDQGR